MSPAFMMHMVASDKNINPNPPTNSQLPKYNLKLFKITTQQVIIRFIHIYLIN
jgi:hypothetical protein